MSTTIKKSTLRELIKECVRESLNELTEKKDKWIQKAVDPEHKGFCTPMTKATCTPRRKALAKRFKKGLENESQGGMSIQKDYEDENSRMSKMQEVAPPGFGPGKVHSDIYNKVKKQYGTDSPKAYATMWAIHNKMTEVAEGMVAECDCEHEDDKPMDEAGLTSEGGPQYKVVAPTQAQVQKDDQAKKVQCEPKVNETAYKTQGPSYKVHKDSPQFPKAVNDPKNA
jgi:hypothetical protein